jgi:hypothetical protein
MTESVNGSVHNIHISLFWHFFSFGSATICGRTGVKRENSYAIDRLALNELIRIEVLAGGYFVSS